MGLECRTHATEYLLIFVENLQEKRPHKRPNIRWDYNIKMDFKEKSCQRAE